ncbi:EAL domain-containing protein [Sporosarcina sp. ACRSM]|uniref:EAL domain-containing protein n=1 Tax=Sporosarcina sp. ACRSM TaxID=2918216 RepID=UPI001EF6BD76|nr:EAL domain-containing protein [Sporosarcina sp. ACRSM]MCG7337056.1 EAL domain-containing protein [Sporosarcina sp. ACRSM]
MSKIPSRFVKPSPISNNKSLTDSAKHLDHFDELIDFGLWKYDVRADKGIWSKKMFEIFDMKSNKAPSLGKVLERVHVGDRGLFLEWYEKVIKDKKGSRFAYRIVDGDGNLKFLDQACDVVIDDNGTVVQLIGTTIDRSEKQKIETAFENYIHKVRKVTEVIEAGVWSMDRRNDSMNFQSPRLSLISGYESINPSIDRNTWRNIIHKEDVAIYDRRNEEVKTKNVQSIEYRIIHKSGEIKWVRDEVIPTYDEEGNLLSIEGVITDITKHMEHEQRMTYYAYHDHLTGLPNRRLFEEKLMEIMEDANANRKTFSVLYMDLDGFKRINDTLGHLIGDQLLEEFSKRVNLTIPEQTLFSRFGGDEFVMVIPNDSGNQKSVQIAEKLLENLQKPYEFEDVELYATASIGISTYPFDGDNVKTLIENADKALYLAKEMGKNTYQLFMPSMNVETYKLYTLDQDLRKAMERNEFTLHYQPKVEPKSGLMVGAEALIRWNHPEWKLVSAGEFIPLSEENGLIFPITTWVFRSVCEQLKAWITDKVVPVPISINISPKLFLKVGWENELLQIIEETGTDPNLLELEITESELIKNDESFANSISKLKSSGIKISLDDFGTGYSSLFYLKQFELDTLKLDRSLITPLDEKSSIIKAVIRLAHDMNMTVVAEGVETVEQRNFLSQQECDQIQGFLFSKPIPPEEFIKFLRQPILRPDKEHSPTFEKERRKGFRIETAFPLSGEMMIIKYKGNYVTTGSTEILIENIGIGGLGFMSTVDLPVNPDILMDFKTEILGETIVVTGFIVWRKMVGEFFQYGIQFIHDEARQQSFIKLLKKFANQLQKNPVPANCRFMKNNIYKHLSEIRNS